MNGEPIRVLLVEDDEDDYLLTRLIFSEIEAAMFNLHWVQTYESALRQIEALKPDVCLVDYRLGAHTGLELIRECSRIGCKVPMILLTGQGDRDVDMEAMEAGAMDYLVKGQISPHLLERSIRYAIERHKTIEQLQQYALIVQNSDDAILGKTLDGVITSWNRGAEKMYGYTAEEIIGKSIYTIVPPDRHSELAQILERLKQGETVEHLETVRVRKDGTKVEVSVTISPIKDTSGRIIGASAIGRDITERKRAEEAVHEADHRAIREYERLLERIAALAQSLGTARDLKTIFQALRDFALASTPCSGIFISLYDPERGARTAAYAWSEGEEVDVSRLPTLPMTDSPHSRAISAGEIVITDDFQKTMEGKPVINVGMERDPRLPQSSLVVPMSVMGRVVGAIEVQSTQPAAFRLEHATAMRMAANLAANAIENVRLIEREHESAEQLRQSQKLEAIGQLAGGVAHDFNNLLTAITGYGELALRRLREEDPLRHNVEEIRKAADRAGNLTRQLLAFSRKQVLQPRVINLNSIIADMEKMLRRLIGEHIELRALLGKDLGQIKADPGQIEQVIVNLVINARDAMPKGGKITVETANVFLDEEYSGRHITVTPGWYAILAVSDTGEGMDEKTREHIFEPFFTTKGERGTGLGLSTVYGIVKQSGGNIWVYSEPEQGTTFKVYLPLVNEPVAAPEVRSKVTSLSGTETILLVEDEDMVRNLARESLEFEGYTVLEAANGGEALLIAQKYEGAIHLILTDVVMPKMSGKEVVEQLTKLKPSMRALYMSGYTDDAVVNHGILDPDIAFIQKPFTPEALARKVREVLDAET